MTDPAERTRQLVLLVTLELDKTEIDTGQGSIRLSSGMSGSAEIHIGRRRILEYIFSPLTEITSEALQER